MKEFKKKEPIHKGWSSDQKFKVELADGRKACLRLAPESAYHRKKLEMTVLKQLSEQGLPVVRPLEMGKANGQVYQLLEWMKGQDCREILPQLSPSEAYQLGRQAGDILLSIHSLSIDQSQMDWSDVYQTKIDKKVVAYQTCGLVYECGQSMLRFVKENRHLVGGRPIAYHHGDFHIGNFLLDEQQQLLVIDFDRLDIGDPWEEFNRLVFTATESPQMASGMVDAYFKEGIPEDFWRLLALYMTVNSLGALAWAKKADPAQIPFMQEQAEKVVAWYDDYKRMIPTWYGQ